ncbi:MAG: enoyl-CoA hydratase [Hyphomonadaceae bacterium]
MATYENLIVEKTDGYALVTFNRPHAYNALSVGLITDIVTAMKDFETDPDVQVVILTGAGKAFCAGLDVDELSSGKLNEFMRNFSGNPAEAMANFPGPVIAAINGPCATGGFETTVACDIILAGESGRFIDTHAKIGLVPGWGLSQRLYRAIGLYRAKEIAFTARSWSAKEAAEWGLVNRVVPDAELLQTARDLAKQMIANYPGILPKLKKLMNEGSALPLGEALKFERAYATEVSASITPDAINVKNVGSRGKK